MAHQVFFEALIRLLSSFSDPKGKVYSMRILFKPNKELPGSLTAVHEGGVECLQSCEVVAVNVRQEASKWPRIAWNLAEIVHYLLLALKCICQELCMDMREPMATKVVISVTHKYAQS